MLFKFFLPAVCANEYINNLFLKFWTVSPNTNIGRKLSGQTPKFGGLTFGSAGGQPEISVCPAMIVLNYQRYIVPGLCCADYCPCIPTFVHPPIYPLHSTSVFLRHPRAPRQWPLFRRPRVLHHRHPPFCLSPDSTQMLLALGPGYSAAV